MLHNACPKKLSFRYTRRLQWRNHGCLAVTRNTDVVEYNLEVAQEVIWIQPNPSTSKNPDWGTPCYRAISRKLLHRSRSTAAIITSPLISLSPWDTCIHKCRRRSIPCLVISLLPSPKHISVCTRAIHVVCILLHVAVFGVRVCVFNGHSITSEPCCALCIEYTLTTGFIAVTTPLKHVTHFFMFCWLCISV
jgi:hypothetical protein